MPDISQYVEIAELDHEKDYERLEGSPGFVVEAETPTAAINTAADARFIALLDFAPGSPRGNHYHLRKIEYMTVLTGELQCDFRLVDDPAEVLTITLRSGQCARILPGCIHTFTALGDPVKALEYSPQEFEAADVHNA